MICSHSSCSLSPLYLPSLTGPHFQQTDVQLECFTSYESWLHLVDCGDTKCMNASLHRKITFKRPEVSRQFEPFNHYQRQKSSQFRGMSWIVNTCWSCPAASRVLRRWRQPWSDNAWGWWGLTWGEVTLYRLQFTMCTCSSFHPRLLI